MLPRHVSHLLLPLSVALSPAPASAAAVSLSYRVPEGCPAQQEFIQALRERGAALDSAGATARARAVDVVIRRVDGAYVGQLTVHSLDMGSPDRDAATRTVHDADCAEVVSGLALTAAIALGGGQAAAEPAPFLEPDPVPSADTGTNTPPRAVSVAPAPAEPVRRLRGSSFGLQDSVSVAAGTLQLEAARAYTLTAGATFGLIPDKVVPRYELNASLASFLGLPGGESRLFGPLLQVHWAALGPVTTRHAGVMLDSWGLEAGINSCSALTYDTAGWVALLCAEFGAGWLFSNGKVSGAAASEFEEQPGYGYGGVGFDVQYNFGSWAHLGLRAGGRLSTQLSVDSPDGTRLFESSPWGGYATIGFGLHF
jgi:hypothetical protein